MSLHDGISAAKGQVRLYTYPCVRLINNLIKKCDSTSDEPINYTDYAYIYNLYDLFLFL